MKIWVPTFIMVCSVAISCSNGSDTSSSPISVGTQSQLSEEETQEYIDRGKQIAQTSFKALSSELTNAMARGGISEAVSYCNVQAYPLTDSLATAFDVIRLKRATDKPRNLKNAASKDEQAQLALYKKQLMQAEQIQPVVKLASDSSVVFYAPIKIKGQCLTCHGNKEGMGEDYNKIKALYPEDKAINYDLGDLRGLWSIEFKKG